MDAKIPFFPVIHQKLNVLSASVNVSGSASGGHQIFIAELHSHTYTVHSNLYRLSVNA